MFVRKSGRLNENLSSNQSDNPVAQEQTNPHSAEYSSGQSQKQKQRLQQQRYFNSSQIVEPKESDDSTAFQKVFNDSTGNTEQRETSGSNASATTKALNQLELDGPDKKKWKKTSKVPMAGKRKKLNQRLSKLLMPKSALILLHELKPGCVYKVQEQVGSFPVCFYAQVDLNGQVLGTGQGLTKSQAKNSAAESAIKLIVSRTMARCAEGKEENASVNEDIVYTPEDLPWAGLASFAIYKMFSEWQNQGTDLLPITRPTTKKACIVNAPTKKDLPPNATEMHPAVVLNMVNPGLQAVELEREGSPKCRVKMAYVIDGKAYSGVGGNKKNAKKEAAKAVLKELYGLSYES